VAQEAEALQFRMHGDEPLAGLGLHTLCVGFVALTLRVLGNDDDGDFPRVANVINHKLATLR
jgi:hypothetical protein